MLQGQQQIISSFNNLGSNLLGSVNNVVDKSANSINNAIGGLTNTVQGVTGSLAGISQQLATQAGQISSLTTSSVSSAGGFLGGGLQTNLALGVALVGGLFLLTKV